MKLKFNCLILSVLFLSLPAVSLAESPKELLKKATLLFQSGDYRGALKTYEKVLKIGISSPKIYNNIGVIYTKLYESTHKEEYLKKAIAFFTLSSSLDKNYKVADKNLSEVLNGYLKEKLQEAEKKKHVKKPAVPKRFGFYPPIKDSEVLSFLATWKSYWENKDPKYFSLYSPNGCMDFERFVRYKKRVWKKSKNIKVRIEDIHIRHNPDNTVCVHFRQLYSSSVMKSRARKALCLRKENGKIKIYCEWFIPTVRIE